MGQTGLTEPGNIDLYNRPHVKNKDGSVSTVRSLGVNFDGQEVLIPTVSPDGRVVSNEEAIKLYQDTGQHLGKFDTPEHSTAYAKALHNDYAAGKYDKPPEAPHMPDQQPVIATLPDGTKIDFPPGTSTEEVIAEVNRRSAPAPAAAPPKPPSVAERMLAYGKESWGASAPAALLEQGIGAAKGLGQTAADLGSLVHKVPGFSAGVDAMYGTPGLSDKATKEANRVLAPTNLNQQGGKFVEQAAEFAIPTGAAEKVAAKVLTKVPKIVAAAPRFAPMVVRAGAQSAASAASAGVHGENVGVAAGLGAAAPILGTGVSAAATSIGSRAIPYIRSGLKLTNTSLKQAAGASRRGLNAGADDVAQFVLDNRLLTRDSGEALVKNIEARIQAKIAGGTKPVDAAQQMLSNLDELIAQARGQADGGGADIKVFERLKEGLKNGPLFKDAPALGNAPKGFAGDTTQTGWTANTAAAEAQPKVTMRTADGKPMSTGPITGTGATPQGQRSNTFSMTVPSKPSTVPGASSAATPASTGAAEVAAGARPVPPPMRVVAPGKPAKPVRVMRTDVGPEEALDMARTEGVKNRGAWGQRGSASREAGKAKERGIRDATKDAYPETKPDFAEQSMGLKATRALDEMEKRQANREGMSLGQEMAYAAAAAAGGGVAVSGGSFKGLAAAAPAALFAGVRGWIRNNPVKAGIYAKDIEKAIMNNNTQEVASLLSKAGVRSLSELTGPDAEMNLSVKGEPTTP